MYRGVPVKYPLFLSNCDQTRIFSTEYGKIFEYQPSRKYAKWGLRFPCGQTGMTTPIVAFLSCANASKKCEEMKALRNKIQRTP